MDAVSLWEAAGDRWTALSAALAASAQIIRCQSSGRHVGSLGLITQSILDHRAVGAGLFDDYFRVPNRAVDYAIGLSAQVHLVGFPLVMGRAGFQVSCD